MANVLSRLSGVVLSQTLVYLTVYFGDLVKTQLLICRPGGGPETEFPPSSQLMPIMLAFLNQYS